MPSTLVLNSSFQPLGAISEEEAIALLYQDVVWVLLEDEVRKYRSQHVTIAAPTVVVHKENVQPKSFQYRPQQLNNSNLFKRDNYTCQYCGRRSNDLYPGEQLTRDHVIPVSRGGKNTWDNVTTACETCNRLKDNRLISETDMTLKTRPKIPITWVIRGKAKLSQKQIELAERFLGLSKG